MDEPPDPRVSAWLAGYREGLTKPMLRAIFVPFLRTSPIQPLTVRAGTPGTIANAIRRHLDWEAGPFDVTIRPDLSGGVVWVGNHCTDQGWIISLALCPACLKENPDG